MIDDTVKGVYDLLAERDAVHEAATKKLLEMYQESERKRIAVTEATEKRFFRQSVAIVALKARCRRAYDAEELDSVFVRASGDCVCADCGLAYREHVEHPMPTFHVLCDGSLVKL